MTKINVDEVSKTYGDFVALNNINLEINDNDFFGLIGNNGAGKTTLLKIMTGQETINSGDVTVLGFKPQKSPDLLREEIGVVPEKKEPPSFLTPEEYFDFISDVYGIDNEDKNERIEEWIELFDFKHKLKTINKNLSRGQQQKVMLISAFLPDPEIIFIDEPLVNLDPVSQNKIKNKLKSYHNSGKTIILSTHNINVALELCDKIGILSDGNIIDVLNVTDDEITADKITTKLENHD